MFPCTPDQLEKRYIHDYIYDMYVCISLIIRCVVCMYVCGLHYGLVNGRDLSMIPPVSRWPFVPYPANRCYCPKRIMTNPSRNVRAETPICHLRRNMHHAQRDGFSVVEVSSGTVGFLSLIVSSDF